jgi:hypothetical protein
MAMPAPPQVLQSASRDAHLRLLLEPRSLHVGFLSLDGCDELV